MYYHFSEEPGIRRFKPRPSAAFPHYPPVVFAIDEEHAAHYFFPRDCPRVIYWKADSTTEEDLNAFFSHTAAAKIIAVENGWLERIRSTKLYVYTFAEESFECFDGTAGYYISTSEVAPLNVEPVGDLLKKLLGRRVELTFTPSLHPIRDKVVASTVDFSIIRFRNARKQD
ncbi:hypothetical protein KZ483_06350 [Paenibacillus sp. sptzw28]|uniref:DUF6886 family protein n=1 Tax=Paenibacillus sp. sptzw28 TaxID=715179 RepID=UPI001C6F59D8|nr:DUF6886 family protein [Paenibacillus sp. sptzw28]QYR22580.1 hypothetical protein KZ483_06350 [Paenibacillus sp. sptzw28]